MSTNRLAESVTSTLVYTYTSASLSAGNAAGLRVAQSIDGDVIEFVWGQALGLAQVLATSDGALHLYGEGRIAEVRGDEWAYSLPDHLGSVRQWVDGDGAVTYAAGYTPYGEELWQQGSTQSAWGYTGEWSTGYIDLLYLRSRWYSPDAGRFTSPDTIIPDYGNPQSVNLYAYVLGNPVNLTDPSGFCAFGEPDYYECMRLAKLLAEALGQPGLHRDFSTSDTDEQRFQTYAKLPYSMLLDLWAQTDPVPDYEVIEQEATRFGLPSEFIAAVIAAEVMYDTGWQNIIYDTVTTCIDWLQPDFLPLNPFARLHMELWYYYYGLGPLYVNPEHGFGEGPAPGIGNVHAGVAEDVERYFATNYVSHMNPEENMLPSAQNNAQRLERLRRYDWNIRYVAAYLRMLADIRTDRKGPHPDLTDTDMEMIFVAYHADLEWAFGSDPDPITNFQRKTFPDRPEAQAFANQLRPFLGLYRQSWKDSSPWYPW